MKNRNHAPDEDHVFPNNRRLLDKLNARAYAGMPENVYQKMYVRIERDAHNLGRWSQYDKAGDYIVSKGAAVYDDLHVYCKKSRAELKALFEVTRDSNESIAARCYAALSYKHLSGERP